MTVGLIVSFGGVVMAVMVLVIIAEIMMRQGGREPEQTGDLDARLSRAELAAKHAQEEIAQVREILLQQR